MTGKRSRRSGMDEVFDHMNESFGRFQRNRTQGATDYAQQAPMDVTDRIPVNQEPQAAGSTLLPSVGNVSNATSTADTIAARSNSTPDLTRADEYGSQSDDEDPMEDLRLLEMREEADSDWDKHIDLTELTSAETPKNLDLASEIVDYLLKVSGQDQASTKSVVGIVQEVVKAWEDWTRLQPQAGQGSSFEYPAVPRSDAPITRQTLIRGIRKTVQKLEKVGAEYMTLHEDSSKNVAADNKVYRHVADYMIGLVQHVGLPYSNTAYYFSFDHGVKEAMADMRYIGATLKDFLTSLEESLSPLEEAPVTTSTSAISSDGTDNEPQSSSPQAASVPKAQQSTSKSAKAIWSPEEDLFVWTLFWDQDGKQYEPHRSDGTCIVSCSKRTETFNQWRNTNDLKGERTWASMEQHVKTLSCGVVSKEGKRIRDAVTYEQVRDGVVKAKSEGVADVIIADAVSAAMQALADAKAAKADKKSALKKRKRTAPSSSSDLVDTTTAGTTMEETEKSDESGSRPLKRKKGDDGGR